MDSGGPPAGAAADPKLLTARQIGEQLDQFLVSAGALARVNDAGRDHGQIRAFNNRTFDVAKAVPTLVMRNEDYGRISRLLADKMDVQLEMNIVRTARSLKAARSTTSSPRFPEATRAPRS